MVEKKVVDYLLEGKKRGFSIQLLKQKLIDGGWDEEVVKEAIDFVEGKIQVPTIRAPVQTAVLPPTSPSVSTMQAIHSKPLISSGDKLGVFRKIGLSIAHPTELFEKTESEGIWPTLKYLWVVSLFPFALLSVATFLILSFLNAVIEKINENVINGEGLPTMSGPFEGILFLFMIFFVFVPILMFVLSGVLHLFVKIFKGQGSYAGTFKAQVYSMTPSLLFFFIPFIGIWSLILNIFGISSYHKISKFRAFLAMLTLWILASIIFLVMVFILGISMIGLANSNGGFIVSSDSDGSDQTANSNGNLPCGSVSGNNFAGHGDNCYYSVSSMAFGSQVNVVSSTSGCPSISCTCQSTGFSSQWNCV